MAIRRPNPALWLYYQYGGKLSARYREWVLHDGTCRTWMVRVFIRGMVQLAPILAGLLTVLVVIGGSWPLALGSVLLGFLVGIRYSLSYAIENVDARLARHGYPARYGSGIRREAYQAAHALDAERYRAAWRQGTDDQ